MTGPYKNMLIEIIKTKKCYIATDCILHIIGRKSILSYTCPLLNRCCAASTEEHRVEHYYEVIPTQRYPEFVQQAAEMFVEHYGQEELFEAIL